MSLVLGGQTFLRSLVGWDSVNGDENEDEDEAKSEDRIDRIDQNSQIGLKYRIGIVSD